MIMITSNKVLITNLILIVLMLTTQMIITMIITIPTNHVLPTRAIYSFIYVKQTSLNR